jgi:hypothetical protein
MITEQLTARWLRQVIETNRYVPKERLAERVNEQGLKPSKNFQEAVAIKMGIISQDESAKQCVTDKRREKAKLQPQQGTRIK